MLVDRAADRLPAVFPELVGSDDVLFVGAVDLADPEAVDAMVERALARFGRLDVLVNTAGGFRGGAPVHETSVETWDLMLNVNARSVFLASRAVDCALDVQGRILLPSALRAAAGLQREAVIVGVLDRFEVRAPPAWEGFLSESERALDDVSLDVPWPLPPSGLPPGTPSPGRHPQGKPNS